jgi:hypothetical protein
MGDGVGGIYFGSSTDVVRIKNDGIVTGSNVRDPISDEVVDDENAGGDGVRLVLARDGGTPSPEFMTDPISAVIGLSPVVVVAEASVEPTNPRKLLLLPAEEWLRRRKNNDETMPPPVSLLPLLLLPPPLPLMLPLA